MSPRNTHDFDSLIQFSEEFTPPGDDGRRRMFRSLDFQNNRDGETINVSLRMEDRSSSTEWKSTQTITVAQARTLIGRLSIFVEDQERARIAQAEWRRKHGEQS